MPKSCTIAARGVPGASKIDGKSLPGASRDAPCCPIAFGRHSGSVLEASRSARGVPRDRPEGPQERPGTPGRALRSAWERFGAAKIDAKSRPGAQTSSFFRAARSRSVVVAIVRRFSSIFGFSVKSANPPKYRACQQNQGFGHSRCESHRSGDATLKNTENRYQSRPEIVENRVSGRLARPFRIGNSGIYGFSGVPDASEAPESPDSPEIPEYPGYPPSDDPPGGPPKHELL